MGTQQRSQKTVCVCVCVCLELSLSVFIGALLLLSVLSLSVVSVVVLPAPVFIGALLLLGVCCPPVSLSLSVVSVVVRQACVDWSCSSYLLYAVAGARPRQGCAKGAQPLVEGPELSRALKKLANQHKETQTPSEVP